MNNGLFLHRPILGASRTYSYKVSLGLLPLSIEQIFHSELVYSKVTLTRAPDASTAPARPQHPPHTPLPSSQ